MIMSHRRCFIAAMLVSLPLLLTVILPTRQQLKSHRNMTSIQIVDRNGTLLREILSRNDATSRYARLDDISPWVQQATLVSEDRRYYLHRGIDPLAVMRSVLVNLWHGDIISGGSTITQQLARNMLGSPPRTMTTKIIEACVALNLELKLSKDEILELYFNYAPYANQTYGIEAASHLYFQKPSRDLSLAEAAFLAGLPRAPSMLDPYRYPDRALEQQRRILDALRDCGLIDLRTYHDALSQPITLVPKHNFNAPHFCNVLLQELVARDSAPVTITTTLDLHLQHGIEHIITNNLQRLTEANVTNAAAILLDIRTMEVLAYVGSADFFNPLIDGEVDGIRALRQPGSALKPFMYAIALSSGATAATLIPDLPTHARTWGGDYTPRNYDEKYHGFVRLRTALACSYNIPAVRVCEAYGPDMLLATLRKLDFRSLDKSPVHYGLGLTLGNGEVTLMELTRAFAVFSHGGHYIPERMLTGHAGFRTPRHQPLRVFDAAVSYIITDILADNNARSPAFGEYSPLNLPFFCAAKTGTSKDFRDNWCIGFTDSYAVGVWVGNFNGSPMNGVSGITGAGPIFRDIMLLAHRTHTPGALPQPDKIVRCTICSESGLIAGPDCEHTLDEYFVQGTQPHQTCRHGSWVLYNTHPEQAGDVIDYNTPFRITFPDDGDIFKIDPVLRQEFQQLSLQLSSRERLKHAAWYVDNDLIAEVDAPYTVRWQLEPGYHDITIHAVTSDDRTMRDTVRILVLK
jgi:penicillin-binding protein 1C